MYQVSGAALILSSPEAYVEHCSDTKQIQIRRAYQAPPTSQRFSKITMFQSARVSSGISRMVFSVDNPAVPAPIIAIDLLALPPALLDSVSFGIGDSRAQRRERMNLGI